MQKNNKSLGAVIFIFDPRQQYTLAIGVEGSFASVFTIFRAIINTTDNLETFHDSSSLISKTAKIK
jgi:hypothetical protein